MKTVKKTIIDVISDRVIEGMVRQRNASNEEIKIFISNKFPVFVEITKRVINDYSNDIVNRTRNIDMTDLTNKRIINVFIDDYLIQYFPNGYN